MPANDYKAKYNLFFEGNSAERLEKAVLIAMLDVALEVGVEADGAAPAANRARRVLATRVTRKPREWVDTFTLVAASEAASNDDADVKAAIAGAWDVVSGAKDAS